MTAFRWPNARHSEETIDAVADLYLERNLTRGQIALKLKLSDGQVGGIINHYGLHRDHDLADGRAEIARCLTYERLCWAHGPERADAIMDGTDPLTRADIAAWERLGRKAVAA